MTFKNSLVVTLLLFLSFSLTAQIFSTQTQVDNACLSGPCTLGQVTIDDNGTDPIKNLDGFAGVVSTQNLKIENNPLLEDIDGLADLRTVSSLFVINNPKLENLNGLSGLTNVGAILELRGLPLVETFDPLNGLNPSIQTITLHTCPKVLDINFLSSLTTSPFRIKITGMNITNISGLSNLTSANDIFFEGCPSLENFNGFNENLVINNGLRIFNCDGLTDLSGLEFLTDPGAFLTVEKCDNLTDIDALSNLRGTSYGIKISENPMLADCSGLVPFLSQDPMPSSVELFSNLPECNSSEAIFENQLSGLVDLPALTGWQRWAVILSVLISLSLVSYFKKW